VVSRRAIFRTILGIHRESRRAPLHRRNIMRVYPHWYAAVVLGSGLLFAQAQDPPPTSYLPVVPKDTFTAVRNRMSAAKADLARKQLALLEERYDLSNRPASGVTMSRNKPVQQGVRVKLPPGVTWDQLAGMTPDEV